MNQPDDPAPAPEHAGEPAIPPNAAGDELKSLDIFPWNDHFNTGLPEVDMQHRVLVRLLNQLASYLAFDPGRAHIDRVLDELGDYAVYHFATEEEVWNEHLPDDAERARHKAQHGDFVAALHRLRVDGASKPTAAVGDEILAFLARWLAVHILEHDHYFACVVRGVRAGLAPQEAERRAREEMQGAMRVLIDLMLATYKTLATNTAKLLREMAERQRIEYTLQESEVRFRTIVEQSPVGIMLSKSGRLLDANDACVQMFGYATRSEMLGSDIFDNIAPHCRAEVKERNRRRVAGEPVETLYETVGLRKDGSQFPLALVPRIIRTHEGPLTAAFQIDLSERKRAEAAERSLNRTVKLLSRCNSLLVRTTDEQTLLAGVCQLAVEVGGYLMSWVGYAQDDAEQSVRPVAQYGHEQDYLNRVRISWGDNPLGQGPSGTAIRTGRTAAAQDIAHAPEWAIWREVALARGYRAAIALPLHVEDQVIGMLAIYSADAGAFGPEEVEVLEELAGDLSYGIQALRLRGTRERVLRDLRRESDTNRALLHNASDGVHILDEQGDLIEASDSFCAMLGYTRAELMGKHLSSWDAGKLQGSALAEGYRRVLHSNRRLEIHTRHRRRDGTLLDVEISTFPLTFEGRRVLFNSSRDVTESLRTRSQLEQTTQDLRRLLADFEAKLEAERTHIAREVHDELGQTLTSLGFAISTLRVKYGATQPELLALARDMSSLNERALQVARNVAENLRPAVLNMGIVAAIEWLCAQAQRQAGLRCDFRTTPNLDDLDQAQVDAVFRVVQESLTNVMRHAGASRVSILLGRYEDELHLEVHDNGRGFDPAQPAARRSFGLRGIEERVRGMGGELYVTSAPEEGATVVAHMPCRTRGEAR